MKASRALIAAFGGAAFLLTTAVPAAAQQSLLGFTDDDPFGFTIAFLSNTQANWAAQWSQTAPSSGVTISAVLGSIVGPAPSNWWITSSLGPTTTATDVLFSGTYVAPSLTIDEYRDFDIAPRTVLATGLSFLPGTYYLVLDGPDGSFSNNADWVGGSSTLATAPGFSSGGYFFSDSPPTFGPSGRYSPASVNLAWFIETAAVPEPATWAMMIIGFGFIGGAMRSRRQPKEAGRQFA